VLLANMRRIATAHQEVTMPRVQRIRRGHQQFLFHEQKTSAPRWEDLPAEVRWTAAELLAQLLAARRRGTPADSAPTECEVDHE